MTESGEADDRQVDGGGVEVREVAFGSSEYDACCRVREEVLRVPLWQKLTAADVAGEDRQHHIAAFAGRQVVGCVVLNPLDGRRVKLRQMAVVSQKQRSGVGTALVREAEAVAVQNGYATIELAARETAIAFYERLGYAVVSEPYEIIGLTHRTMEKTLAATSVCDAASSE